MTRGSKRGGGRGVTGQVHELRGTHRRDRHGPKARERSVSLDREAPTPPAGLSEDQMAEWTRVCNALLEDGIALTELQRPLLLQYVMLWSEARASGWGGKLPAWHAQFRGVCEALGFSIVAQSRAHREGSGKRQRGNPFSKI